MQKAYILAISTPCPSVRNLCGVARWAHFLLFYLYLAFHTNGYERKLFSRSKMILISLERFSCIRCLYSSSSFNSLKTDWKTTNFMHTFMMQISSGSGTDHLFPYSVCAWLSNHFFLDPSQLQHASHLFDFFCDDEIRFFQFP